MPQQSGPITGLGFTDDTWRDIFGAEPAIEGDVNGTAYQLTLPTGTDVAQLGSPSQDSKANVAGRSHKIPAGQTEGLTIPPSSNPAVGRTDLIVCRFDPAWQAAAPGPVRLFRVPGVEGSAVRPAYDGDTQGVEDLPLYAITRKKDQSLNQAAVVDLRTRTGPNLLLAKDDDLPGNVPLGTRAVRAGRQWIRELNQASTPTWREMFDPVVGDRPFVQIGRPDQFGTDLAGQSPLGLYAGTVTRKRADADAHFTTAYGATNYAGAKAGNVAYIQVKTSGTYVLNARAEWWSSAAFRVSLALNIPNIGYSLDEPIDYATVTPVGGLAVAMLNISDTLWLPAGTRFQPAWSTYGNTRLKQWWMWARRIAD